MNGFQNSLLTSSHLRQVNVMKKQKRNQTYLKYLQTSSAQPSNDHSHDNSQQNDIEMQNSHENNKNLENNDNNIEQSQQKNQGNLDINNDIQQSQIKIQVDANPNSKNHESQPPSIDFNGSGNMQKMGHHCNQPSLQFSHIEQASLKENDAEVLKELQKELNKNETQQDHHAHIKQDLESNQNVKTEINQNHQTEQELISMRDSKSKHNGYTNQSKQQQIPQSNGDKNKFSKTNTFYAQKTLQLQIPLNIASQNHSKLDESSNVNMTMERQMTLKQSVCLNKINFLYENKHFDGDKAPPNMEKALNHGKAQRVCKAINYFEDQKEVCECCGKAINNEQLAMCDHPNGLKHIGAAYPVYFVFMKQCFIFMFAHFLIQALPALILYSGGGFCEKYGSSTLICKSSFLNILDSKTDSNLQRLSFLNFIAVLVQLFLIEIFKIVQKKRVQMFEKDRISVQYYSIIIKKIPSNITIEGLEDFLEKHVEGSKQQIERIFILYDLSAYEKTNQTRKQTVDKLNKCKLDQQLTWRDSKLSEREKQYQYDHLKIDQRKYQDTISDLDEELREIENQIVKEGEFNYKYKKKQLLGEVKNKKINIRFSGRVIITFKTHEMSKKIKNYFKINSWERFVKKQLSCFEEFNKKTFSRFYITKKQKIEIKEAPEPSDILWTGLSSTSNKKALRFRSNVLVFFSLMISLAILVFFKVIIRMSSINFPTFWQLVMNLIAATLVAISNVCIGIIIRKSATKEQRTTQTSYFVQVGKKLTKMFLVNMLLTILLANYFATLIIPEVDNDLLNVPIDLVNMAGEYFFLFITNSYISSIMSIFDIVWGVRLLKRYILRKKISQQICSTSQADANNIFEGHPIDMALRYANVLKVVLYTSAISSLLPIGPPMCLMGILIIYWADKFLLYRRMVCNNYISTLLSKKMIQQLHMSTILFAFGNIVTLLLPQYNEFEKIYNQQTLDYPYIVLSLIGLLIAIILHFMPTQRTSLYNLYMRLNYQKYQKPVLEQEFQELRDIIFDDYDLYHPASRDDKLLEIHERCQKFKSIQSNNNQASPRLDIIQEDQYIQSGDIQFKIVGDGVQQNSEFFEQNNNQPVLNKKISSSASNLQLKSQFSKEPFTSIQSTLKNQKTNENQLVEFDEEDEE